MTDVLASFGVAGDDLATQVGKDTPAVVPGRVAHIDADFMAYIIAADTRDEIDGIKPMRDLRHKYLQVHDFAETIQRKAGASSYVLHITPPGSTKGGRSSQAVQQPYQANRAGKEPPTDLHAIRAYMGTECRSVVHLDQEADDGLAQANYNDPLNSILCSSDKDLLMVPGLHLNMKTYEITDYAFDDFGEVHMDTSTKNATLKGSGAKFFFAQCLMGDAADNIKGLPGLYVPGKKAKPVGPVTACDLLKAVETVKEALVLVRELYQQYAANVANFIHWQTREPVTANQVLLGEMRLLWMRRKKNPDDVLDWLKENM